MKPKIILKEDYIKSIGVLPLTDWIVVVPESVEMDSGLVMPGNRNAERAAGYSMLKASKVGPECSSVKVGDYVITKPGTGSLMSCKIADDEHIMVNEKDIAAVLRDE